MQTIRPLALLALAPFALNAQGPTRWDIAAKHGPSREVAFETSEGTWMSLDVSPDGRTIAFDLLGDIYTMPIAGGRATLVLGGNAYETQPRFSPDGKRIAFTSDRDGLENIWTMNTTGGELKQVSTERERQISNPAWTPDGQYIVARKHFRNTRSLGAGEMWLYHIAGGSGLKMTDRRNWEQNATEPSVSPDGRYVYFSEDVSAGPGFQYNLDPFGIIYVVQRLDRQTGRRSTFISGSGGSLRPQPSPDGKSLAFIRRVDAKTVLFVQDLESGKNRAIWNGLDHDQQEAWAIFGTYSGYAWTPDSKGFVVSAKGKFWSVDVATGTPKDIPFTASVKQTVTDAVRSPQVVAPDKFDVKMLRWVSVSPNNQYVAFTALGHLYVRYIPGGEPPRRVTQQTTHSELHPSWSPDGQSLVYTTWNDDSLGAVRTVRVDGTGARQVTSRPGHYVEPKFSPNGQQIVFRRIGGDGYRGTLHTRDAGVYVIASNGGGARLITEEGNAPRFNGAGDRIYLSSNDAGRAALISVNLTGGERRVHVAADNASEFSPSPDDKYVAWVERFNTYVAPMPVTGASVAVGPSTGEFPARRISRDAGTYIHWSSDSRVLYWSLGPALFRRGLDQTFAFDTQDTTNLRRPEIVGIPIGFQATYDKPSGTVALVGATAITMNGAEVIRNATVVVEGNRITAVGPSGTVVVPAAATRVDVRGKYIMPGIVDVHAHLGGAVGSNGIVARNNWGMLVNLAFGVTTMHDPSNNTDAIFSTAETIKAGGMVGPRVFSTGTILYGAEGGAKAVTNTYDEALTHLRRMQAVGAFSVKSYNQPRRDARQQIVEAARELGMLVVPEGGSTFAFNMSHILDGHTGLEHNIPIAPLYNDVLSLYAASKSGYTPTLVVSFGGLSGEYYWYQQDEVWKNERLARFTPAGILDSRARRRQTVAADDFYHIEVSKAAKALTDRGVKVNLGAHGQLQGLGAHWEMWMLQQGGMTNMEALRAATINGAEYLGLDKDIGSLATGKLADLIVLDRDPLVSVRNSTAIKYTMINGRLFDAATLAQLGNHPGDAPLPFWQGIQTNWSETTGRDQ